MNTTQLKYFNTVARLENMSKASELLHASQPAISKNIAKLEEEIGYSLFDRKGKTLKLNDKGNVFLNYSTEAINNIEKGIKAVAGIESIDDKKIRIGLAASNKRLGNCISSFQKSHPGVQFEVFGNYQSYREMDINEFDMIIYPKSINYNKFNGIFLNTEKCLLAVNVNNKSFKGIDGETKDLDPEELLLKLTGESVLFLKNDKNSEDQLQLLSVLGIEPQKTLYTDTEDLRKMMIRENLAVGIISDGRTPLYDIPEIKLIPINDKRFTREIKICFRKEKHLSPIAKEFIAYVSSFYKLKV